MIDDAFATPREATTVVVIDGDCPSLAIMADIITRHAARKIRCRNYPASELLDALTSVNLKSYDAPPRECVQEHRQFVRKLKAHPRRRRK